ncbi:MAG: hypothetical protein J6V20_02545 [Bacteroidaceae bacterium]|nr:hypothetical protein [Bacteroidaceae bacterium]
MNKFSGIFLTAVSVFTFLACGPGEISYVEEGYLSGIYTANKATLRPEFEDTLYRMNNKPWDFGLETGDRAHVLLHYTFDAYNGKGVEWEIVNVVEEIPTLSLSPREEIDSSVYDMPFDGYTYYELYDSYMRPEWVWNNMINVNVKYKAVAEKTQFVMAVRGVSNDTINLNLFAKTEQLSDTARTKLLTFDLNDIGSLLTDEEKVAINGYERMKFRVHLKYKDKTGKLHDNSFPIMVGDIANPAR